MNPYKGLPAGRHSRSNSEPPTVFGKLLMSTFCPPPKTFRTNVARRKRMTCRPTVGVVGRRTRPSHPSLRRRDPFSCETPWYAQPDVRCRHIIFLYDRLAFKSADGVAFRPTQRESSLKIMCFFFVSYNHN